MDYAYVFLLIFAYTLGAIPFGKIISVFYGIDIQNRGSGNIGFANVNRVIGWKAGAPTLILDILKGYIPTWIAYHHTDQTIAFFVGFVAIIGHIFPIWLRFKGGKGIATGLGILFVLQPIPAIIGSAIYILLCLSTKVSSYSSIVSLVIVTALSACIAPHNWWQYLILALTACWTLRHNFTGKVPNYDI